MIIFNEHYMIAENKKDVINKKLCIETNKNKSCTRSENDLVITAENSHYFSKSSIPRSNSISFNLDKEQEDRLFNFLLSRRS